MISAKILVQSTAAGLMAGAVVLAPLFLFDGVEDEFASPPCTRVESTQLSQFESDLHEQATLRAAPPVASKRATGPKTSGKRTLEERNQAARQAMQQLEQTPVPTVDDHLGADMPASVKQRIEQYRQSQQVAQQVETQSQQSRELSRRLIESLSARDDARSVPPSAPPAPPEHQILLRR
jgi:hypothetical protein